MDITTGQVWRDKDKRRAAKGDGTVVGPSGISTTWLRFSDGTEREYATSRLIERWELIFEPKPVQATYMLKLVCPLNTDMKLRLTRKMIDRYGVPFCGCHKSPMREEN